MKAKTPHQAASRHHRNGATTFDTVLADARQTGRDARAAAMDQFVQPAMDAMRQARHQIEQGRHQTLDSMGSHLKHMRTRAEENPLRTLACAVGVGVLIGLWLGRK
jgi:ElaB/YqjD/DUF883 family membrane-anchored ribosome-binding protein